MLPPDSSPKGSLEDLFRHHLLESQAASVPPAPHIWEQVENTLLLQENQRYRRRLQAARWAMAASLLLAALLGGGWWHSQRSQAGAFLAANTGVPGSTSLPRPAPGPTATGATAQAFASTSTASSIVPTATLPAPTANPSAYSNGLLAGTTLANAARAHAALASAARPAAWLPGYYQVVVSPAEARLLARLRAGTLLAVSRRAGRPAADAGLMAFAITEAASGNGSGDATSPADVAGQLASRQAGLRLPLTTPVPLPALLAANGTSWQPTAASRRPTSPWQLQVAYASSVYNPNIDFHKAPAEYDGSLGPGTVATTSDAAAEYRQNLRGGLGQRLSVWASRRLGIGRWHLRTGLEFNQNTASSASSVGFLGEQVTTLEGFKQVQANKLRTTNYRYRTLSVPLEATYNSAGRRGFSLYGRAGAAVSALLGARSEVVGSSEATLVHAYHNSLYRSLTTSVRGGVGVRYQPATHPWAVTLGPVAEAGVVSLNLDPAQDFWSQQRPYSFGFEAGMELGSWLKPAVK